MTHPIDDSTAVAELLAAHRAVPFLGAGCSYAHVGVGWLGLLESIVGPKARDMSPLAAASAYVGEHGREAFLNALRERLLVDQFDEAKGGVPLYVLAMSLWTIYTTNQDNVVEQCFARFERPLNVVSVLDDFARQDPMAPTLYKYHGHLDHPDSVVFTTEDYAARMDAREHPMDIRLRSDCLSRSMVFLGFSFDDPNVRELLEGLRRVFGGRLPPSYLVQFNSDPEFAAALARDFGIVAIDPLGSFPEISDPAARFDRWMKRLNETVVAIRTKSELGSIFDAMPATGRRVIAAYEIESVGSVIALGEFGRALTAFRGAYDRAFVPPAHEVEVAAQFERVCKLASSATHYGDVKAAFFNLDLHDARCMLTAWSASLAVANVVGEAAAEGPGIDRPMSRGVAHVEDLLVAAVAGAFVMLRDWGREWTPAFYKAVSYWEGRFTHPDDLGEPLLEMAQSVFAEAYATGRTTYENPLARARRLGRRDSPLPGFADWHRALSDRLPRAHRPPPKG